MTIKNFIFFLDFQVSAVFFHKKRVQTVHFCAQLKKKSVPKKLDMYQFGNKIKH